MSRREKRLLEYYSGKIVLVTGVNSGIGRALSTALVGYGASVFGVSRDLEKLRRLSTQLSGGPGTFACWSADLSSFAGCREAFDKFSAVFKRMDILINNAAVGHFSAFESMPRSDYEYVLNTNLLAPVHLASLSIPLLKESGRGRIVNICSSGAFYGIPFRGMYCASKAGMRVWCQALSLELRRYGIEVQWAIPGATRTEFFNNSLGRAPRSHRIPDKIVPPEDIAEKILRRIPGRGGEMAGSLSARAISFLSAYMPFILKYGIIRMIAREEEFLYGKGSS